MHVSYLGKKGYIAVDVLSEHKKKILRQEENSSWIIILKDNLFQ